MGNTAGQPMHGWTHVAQIDLTSFLACPYTFITFAAAKPCCQMLLEVLTLFMLLIQN